MKWTLCRLQHICVSREIKSNMKCCFSTALKKKIKSKGTWKVEFVDRPRPRTFRKKFSLRRSGAEGRIYRTALDFRHFEKNMNESRWLCRPPTFWKNINESNRHLKKNLLKKWRPRLPTFWKNINESSWVFVHRQDYRHLAKIYSKIVTRKAELVELPWISSKRTLTNQNRTLFWIKNRKGYLRI